MKLSKPHTKAGRLQQAVLDLLLEHEANDELPTSNRFLFYELVQRGVLDKSKTRTGGHRGADQDLSDASKRLRDAGEVPWSWIVDETRSLDVWSYAATVADYLADRAKRARIDCWDGVPPPLILCESRTFAGVLRRTIAPAYLCPVGATNGQVGGFLHTNIVPILRGNTRRVLYIGDLDLQGEQIEKNTQRVLVREAGERDWQRVALTEAQATAGNLPKIEGIDRRYDKPHGRRHAKVEVEALGQSVVTNLVVDVLDSLMPVSIEVVGEEELRQQEEAAARLAAW